MLIAHFLMADNCMGVQTVDLLQANHIQILQFVTAKLHPGLNRAFQEAGTPYNDQGPQPQVLGELIVLKTPHIEGIIALLSFGDFHNGKCHGIQTLGRADVLKVLRTASTFIKQLGHVKHNTKCIAVRIAVEIEKPSLRPQAASRFRGSIRPCHENSFRTASSLKHLGPRTGA